MSDPGDTGILNGYKDLTETVMKSVLASLKDHLKADKKHGKRFIITFNNPPSQSYQRMYRVFRKVCKFVKSTKLSKSQVSLYAQCKLSNQAMLDLIKVGIAEKLGGAKYELLPAPEGQIIVAFE